MSVKIKEKKRINFSKNEDKLIVRMRLEDKSYLEIATEIERIFAIIRTLPSLCARVNRLKSSGKFSRIEKSLKKYSRDVSVDFSKFESSPQKVAVYPNEDSKLKHEMRKMVVSEMLQLDEGRILSFPADNFIFESTLQYEAKKERKKFDFVCIEKNDEIYNSGFNTAIKGGFSYIKGEFTEFADKLEDIQFSGIWLDFCGNFSENVKKAVTLINNKNLLKEKGVLAITLLSGREADSLEYLREYLTSKDVPSYMNIRTLGFPRYIKSIFGRNMSMIHTVKYQDNSMNKLCSPMFLYIFKLENVEETNKIIEIKYSNLDYYEL